jgi:DNA-binding MarR family transcriptional regulator
VPHRSATPNDEQAALHKCLLFMEAFRAVSPSMPMQYAYTFLLVASDEGCGVQEYAERAGIPQPVMARILFALGSRHRRPELRYGLVQQSIAPEDWRSVRTFLTAEGTALKQKIVRLIQSDHQVAARGSRKRPTLDRDLVQDVMSLEDLPGIRLS